jgi:transcriptional regulator GlxA family with amidase domain
MSSSKIASGSCWVVAALVLGGHAAAYAPQPEAPEKKLQLPDKGVLKAAFVLSERFTLIDVAGPMQVFDQVQAPGTEGIQTFTVAETKAPITVNGITVTPTYTFDTAPEADIIVVGAQTSQTPKFYEYLRDNSRRGKLMLSVCTGAFKFASAGLLDGLTATTHRDYIDNLARQFPNVSVVRNRAWVHSAPTIYTAGGETSGIELALHITELYWGHDVAVKTAQYMEYRGPDWQR